MTNRNYLFLLIILLNLFSCSDYDTEIKNLQDRVDKLEDTVSALKSAVNSGKIISDVISLPDNQGYNLIFSDGSNISLKQGTDNMIPMVKIDNNGFWIVSYDNGNSYSHILDNNGNQVISKGKDGSNGNSLRVVTDDNGFYNFEVYSSSLPDSVIEVIKTPQSSNQESVLCSVVKNEKNGVITLTLANGSEFKFNLDVSYPTSVIVLNDILKVNPFEDASLRFRLNPSDAYLDFIINGVDSNVELDIITQSRGVTNYVTKPSGYKIASISNDTDADGNIKQGQYIATITSLNNGENISERVCLVITTKNSKGEIIQISSSPFSIVNGEGTDILSVNINGVEGTRTDNVFHVKLPSTTDLKNLKPEFTGNCSSIYPKGVTKSRGYSEYVDFSNPVTYVAVGPDGKTEEYTVVITFSDLPTIYITTSALILSKDEWVKNNTIRIFNAGEQNGEYSASLKGRGNTTWGFPKKPYAIKLDSKEEVLGMPKHKRWCLLANWMDRTNIRNEVAFEVGRRLSGLEWTPRGKFVDLFFNGTPVGNYYLCEQIKIDKNRINIDELEPTDISEPYITGGYLLEFDSYFDETYKFRSSLELPINLKSPDENVPDEQLNYIKNYINTIENKLIAHADFKEIDNLLDINSYVDWWILNEIVLNGEPNNPKSSYMYKKRDGKLFAGPAWDYDWGTFVEGSGWWIKDAIWYKYLFSYPEFISIIKERWNMHKNNLSTIGDYIDKIYYQINESSLYDCTIWPINPTMLGGNYVNGDELLSFSDSVERLKQMYLKRFQWLNKNIKDL